MLSRAPVYSDHKWLQIPDSTVGTYNALDCIATARVHRALMQEQVENGQYDHFRNVYWPMIEHIVELQRRGLRLDRSRLHDYGHTVRAEIERCEDEIASATGVAGTNLNSTRQVASLLFGTLGLKSFKLTDSGADSTDQEALDRCLRNLRKKDEAVRPVLEALFHRSRYSTIEKRYLKLYPDDDGRVRPTIKAGKAETLRLAYADPALQQMPKEIRHVFIPRPGCVFVEADYSQLEARFLAVLSGDRVSLEVFESGGDVHKQNAMDLLSVQLEAWEGMDVERRDASRNLAKCLHPDTRIEMHDGTQRRAQTLKPGEWTSQGVVEASSSVGPAHMVEVRTTAGDRLIVTEDHPFLTEDGWVEAKNLRADKAKGGRRGTGHRLTVLERPSNPELNFPDEFFRMLGYLAGDGGTTAGLTFTNIDPEIVYEFQRCAEVLGGSINQIDYKSYRVLGLGWIADTFGMRGVKSVDKAIPEVVWRSSHRQREFFLAALFECDGSNTRSSAEFGTSSPKLANDLHLMLCQLGIDGSLYHRLPTYKGEIRPTWKRRLAARGNVKSHFWPFVLERKRPALPIRAREWVVQVAEVIDRGFSEAWGVQVSSGQHVTNGILTHNTFLYGISYGGKAETLKAKMFCPCPRCAEKVPNTLALSRIDMKAAEERWFAKHGAVREFRATLDTIARSQGIKRSYTTPFGYKRIFFNPYPEVMTEIYNFPMQAGAAGLVNERFIRAMRAGLPIVLQMHDSFVMECPRSEAMSHARQLKEIMEAPTEQMGGTVFPTDCKIGESWGEMEKVRL